MQVQVWNIDNNLLTGTIPQMASLLVLNATSNHLSYPSFSSLPPSLQALYIADNSFTGIFPRVDMLPASLFVLDVSGNLLSGTLPETLPANLTIFNASNNHLSGSLPGGWARLAELRLDNMPLIGRLPSQWHTWGSNTSNSIQLSIVNTGLSGHMPQQWVQQFCLAVTRASHEQSLFEPNTLDVALGLGDILNYSTTVDVFVPVGSPIILTAQRASINVTLDSKLYSFSYQDPGSLCSIPGAVRNSSLAWGIFAALLLATLFGVRKRKVTSPHAVTKLAVFGTAVKSKLRLPTCVVTRVWVFASDVVWFVYSQVTDAITIHQVFGSGQKGYAFILLAILLLPFVLVFLLVVRISIEYCQARFEVAIAQHASGRFQTFVCRIGVCLVGLALAPVLFLTLEVGMLTEAVGIPLAKWVLPAMFDLATLYRGKSILESFTNALPQAIVQTKLYIMGNSPNGVHVYINTSLFLASVVGSFASILKTVALLSTEVRQYGGLLTYLSKLVNIAPFGSYQSYAANDP